ncbi:hypothetical protein FSP39_014978 [Pinctada imbricata]|uniref:Uncharacterized protein n=1 Tax=Pinctada imbricata TaxID=66713 RepID=A0AA88XNM2_PINIB|nr:hypothetical protein FSP39_014978 [Pinctada imbricata]
MRLKKRLTETDPTWLHVPGPPAVHSPSGTNVWSSYSAEAIICDLSQAFCRNQRIHKQHDGPCRSTSTTTKTATMTKPTDAPKGNNSHNDAYANHHDEICKWF